MHITTSPMHITTLRACKPTPRANTQPSARARRLTAGPPARPAARVREALQAEQAEAPASAAWLPVSPCTCAVLRNQPSSGACTLTAETASQAEERVLVPALLSRCPCACVSLCPCVGLHKSRYKSEPRLMAGPPARPPGRVRVCLCARLSACVSAYNKTHIYMNPIYI